MPPGFGSLLLASLVWFGIHPLVAGSRLRSVLVARLGENAFRGLFSALSLGALVWVVRAYAEAPFWPVWFAPRPIRWLPLLVMPWALILLVGAFTVPNPTAVSGEKALGSESAARGVLRITRHPFLWAVVLWAVVHMLVNGDVASLLFFGSFAATAWVGTFDIDRKRSAHSPSEWQAYRSQTSSVPFGALLEGRNRLVARELLVPVVVGLVVTAGLLVFHGSLFGAPALP
jgi:uncharacterized membrane protein